MNYQEEMKAFIAPDGLVNDLGTPGVIPETRNGGNRVMLTSLARLAEDHQGMNPCVSERFFVDCIKVTDQGLYLKRHPDSDEPQAHDDYIYLMAYLATKKGRLETEVREGLFLTAEMNQYSMFNQAPGEFILKKWFGRHWHFEAHMLLCSHRLVHWFNVLRLSLRLIMDCFVPWGNLSGPMQRACSVFVYVNYHPHRYMMLTLSCFVWQTVMSLKYKTWGDMFLTYRNFAPFPPAELLKSIPLFPMTV